YQVGKTRILDNYSYLCKGLIVLEFLKVSLNKTTKKRVLFPPSFSHSEQQRFNSTIKPTQLFICME
ncbi:hypothetical protein, partial [Bathymodiolus thermophilus thioautotrophic gill symbiont]|uniref:hypothetical protein n=1 Tax=Bathymodiolus thermophilus thioautotrophic gill symbiont TaxID=2360 RepID=UPI001A7E0C63